MALSLSMLHQQAGHAQVPVMYNAAHSATKEQGCLWGMMRLLPSSTLRKGFRR